MSRRKIETSPLILAVVFLSGLWGAMNFNAYLSTRDMISFVYALIGLVGAVGLFFGRSWSQFFIYFATLIFSSWWCYGLYQALTGEIRYDTHAQTFFGLLISFFPVAIAGLCSFIVYRRFSESKFAN